ARARRLAGTAGRRPGARREGTSTHARAASEDRPAWRSACSAVRGEALRQEGPGRPSPWLGARLLAARSVPGPEHEGGQGADPPAGREPDTTRGQAARFAFLRFSRKSRSTTAPLCSVSRAL